MTHEEILNRLRERFGTDSFTTSELRDNRRVHVAPPQLFAILEFLALHRGEVVTRTALYEHLFDESDDTLSNLLDVHVFSIRKKLGHDLIATRRGQGYCIE